ncbi:hypothetical protein Cpir12675_004921 [Ceratocystis pirilliformis]|uniref:Uncharacterized protein n=1 Tax=Ceratocystis pirilliformis TaxID=259994 RepID=A0ABR3YT88_9PEZI
MNILAATTSAFKAASSITAAGAAAATTSAAPMIGPRTVFVKVSPLPITFAERRAVLHALKKQTRIEVFKKMRHAPASFISVADTEEGARKLIDASPLTYDILTTTPEAPLIPEPVVMPTLPQHRAEKQAKDIDTQPSPPPNTSITSNENRRQFVVHMFPSPNYRHMHHISLSPFYGPWKPDTYRKKTVIDALSKNIPQNIRQPGLAEWDPSGFELEESEPAPHGFLERSRRRREIKDQPAVMRGLANYEREVEELRRRRILGELSHNEEAVDKDELQPSDEWLLTHEKPIFQSSKKPPKTSNTSATAKQSLGEADAAVDGYKDIESTLSSRPVALEQDHADCADSTEDPFCIEDSLEALFPDEGISKSWITSHQITAVEGPQTTLDTTLATKIIAKNIQRRETRERIERDADLEAEEASKLATEADEGVVP